MLTVLRLTSIFFLGAGFVGMIVSSGIPYLSSGNLTLFYISLSVFALGWMLLIVHVIKFTARNGWAASGITVPGVVLLSVSGIAAWWFLKGPFSNTYPAIYGIGSLVVALIIASQVLPRVYKLGQNTPSK